MKLQEFLQEENGGLSATRLTFLLWAIGVLVAWIIASLRIGSLQTIDPSIQTIIGILMTGKVIQKFGEKPDTASSSSGTTGVATRVTSS